MLETISKGFRSVKNRCQGKRELTEENIEEAHVGFNQLVDGETIQHFLYRDYPDQFPQKTKKQQEKYSTEELVKATKSIDPDIWK